MRGARLPTLALALAVLLPGCVLRPSGTEEPPAIPAPSGPAPGPGTPPADPSGSSRVAPPGAPTPTTATPTPTAPAAEGPDPAPAPPPPSPAPPAEEPPTDAPTPPAPPPPSPSAAPSYAPGPAAPPHVPARFLAGQDAGPQRLGRYVPAYALGSDGSWLSASLRGVPDATVQVGSLFRVENADALPRTLRLAATASPPPAVLVAELRVRDADGGTLALLDLLAANATADVALPAGAVRDASWTLRLAEGAGEGNASFSTTLALSVVG